MLYTAPTPDQLRAMFPGFIAVDDLTVQAWLDRAARDVDTRWTEGDYAYGIMLLACHLMTGQGIGTGLEAELASAGAGLQRIQSGSFDIQFDRSASAQQVTGGYSSTRYGREFAGLLKRNRGGARVVGGGAAPVCDGYNGWAGPLPSWIAC